MNLLHSTHYPDADNTAATKTITGPVRVHKVIASYDDNPAAAVVLNMAFSDSDDVKAYLLTAGPHTIELGGLLVGGNGTFIATLPAEASVKGTVTVIYETF